MYLQVPVGDAALAVVPDGEALQPAHVDVLRYEKGTGKGGERGAKERKREIEPVGKTLAVTCAQQADTAA